MMFVKDWMRAPAAMLIADVTLEAALRYLDLEEADHVLVIHQGKVAGVTSRAELRQALPGDAGFRLRPRRYLGDLDLDPPTNLHPMDPIEQAARLLSGIRSGALPVLEDGRVRGILAAADVVRACAELLGAGTPGARLIVSGGRDHDMFETIARKSRGLVIRSLAAHRRDGGGWEAVVRVHGPGEGQCA